VHHKLNYFVGELN